MMYRDELAAGMAEAFRRDQMKREAERMFAQSEKEKADAIRSQKAREFELGDHKVDGTVEFKTTNSNGYPMIGTITGRVTGYDQSKMPAYANVDRALHKRAKKPAKELMVHKQQNDIREQELLAKAKAAWPEEARAAKLLAESASISAQAAAVSGYSHCVVDPGHSHYIGNPHPDQIMSQAAAITQFYNDRKR